MTDQIVSISTGTIGTALGSPAIAAFHPMPDGTQQVVVGGGFDENASNALLGLPIVLEAYGGLEAFMTAMGVYCYTEHGLDLKTWVARVAANPTLNTNMQAKDEGSRIAYAIDVITPEEEVIALAQQADS